MRALGSHTVLQFEKQDHSRISGPYLTQPMSFCYYSGNKFDTCYEIANSIGEPDEDLENICQTAQGEKYTNPCPSANMIGICKQQRVNESILIRNYYGSEEHRGFLLQTCQKYGGIWEDVN